MNALVYANTPEKARMIQQWITAFAGKMPLGVTIQTREGAGPAEQEAARILASGVAPGAGVRMVQMKAGAGSPEEAIAAQALEGDYAVVVVAPAGRSGFIRFFYGSMVAHVVKRVATSVLVVRGAAQGSEAGFPPKKVLVCVSGSRHSLTNVTVAAQIAGIFRSDLTVLTVLSQVALDEQGAAAWEGDREGFLMGDHPIAAHLRIAGDLAKGVGTVAAVRVRQGLVVEEIIREVEGSGHDLLVIGTHRAEGFDTVYEDITDALVKASPISTLVVGLRAALL